MYGTVAIIMAFFGAIGDIFHSKRNEANLSYLTFSNFELIRDSPLTDESSEYWIGKTEKKLTFSREPNGYKLFFLILTGDPEEPVILRGLDGYGLRDRVFLNIVCRLVDKLRKNEK